MDNTPNLCFVYHERCAFFRGRITKTIIRALPEIFRVHQLAERHLSACGGKHSLHIHPLRIPAGGHGGGYGEGTVGCDVSNTPLRDHLYSGRLRGGYYFPGAAKKAAKSLSKCHIAATPRGLFDMQAGTVVQMRARAGELPTAGCRQQCRGVALRARRSRRATTTQTSCAAAAGEAQRSAVGFPFVKIVSQEEMKLALMLNVVDSRIGGVLIMGDRGTGKSVAARPELPAPAAQASHTSRHAREIAVSERRA